MNWNKYTYPERVYIAYLIMVHSHDDDSKWYYDNYGILMALGTYYEEYFKDADLSELDDLLF